MDPQQQQQLVKFAPLQSIISAPFWSYLAKKKLHELRLDETPLTIYGHYSGTGKGAIHSRFSITEECLQGDTNRLSAT